jgi:hypothetical protein
MHVIKDGEVIIQLYGQSGRPEILREYGSTNSDDRKSQRIIVELTSGATFAFPPELVEGCAMAPPNNWPKWKCKAWALASTGKALTRITASPA